MKKITKYLSVALMASTVVSCSDLDTEYWGDYVTTDQKENTLALNPELASAAVNAISSQFGSYYGQVYDQHFDFGYPSLMMGMDSQTDSYLAKIPYTSSHVYWFGFVQRNPNGVAPNYAWYILYKQISLCNTLAVTIPADTDNDELKFFRAQALTVRAFDYWNLAQLYQFNYTLNPSAPCVPLITDENEQEAAANGAPRATCEEVYAQIMKDLDEAVTLLEGSSTTRERVLDVKPKRMVNLAVALGMRARVNLTMHKYAEAAKDAAAAIAAHGGAPYSIADVSVPSFNASEASSWMWCIYVADSDRPVTTGICNWPSQLGSFNDGYANFGGWRWMNSKLWNSIPSTDVRKGWFLDENFTSPNLTAAQQNYLNQYIDPDGRDLYGAMTQWLMPYTQVKFGLFGGSMGGYCSAYDVPLMRVEEMYLIQAEATAMAGNAPDGANILTNFVKTYRDPAYAFTSSSAEAVQNEVVRQRSIELWGEGLVWFDIMRLNRGIDRTNGGAMDEWNYKIEPGFAGLIYCIPQGEVNANRAISEDDNNPAASTPQAIPQ